MIARMALAWSAWCEINRRAQQRERESLAGMAMGVALYAALGALGQLDDGEGRPWMPHPWAGIALGVGTLVIFSPWVRRIQRGAASTTEVGLAVLFVLAGLQASFLLLANAAHGVFLYALALLYVFTASAQGWRTRGTLRHPFPFLAWAAAFGVGCATSPGGEHTMLYALLGLWVPMGSGLLGAFSASNDEARDREAALRAENAALLLELKHGEVARLEAFLDQIAGRTHDIGGPAFALDLALGRASEALDAPPSEGGWERARELVRRASRHGDELRAMLRRAKEEVRALALPEEDAVSIDEVVRAAAELARLRFPAVEIEVSGAAEDLVVIRGGREALARVLENVVANAGEAVTRAAQRSVRVTWSRAGERARIAVEDAGPGFGAARAPSGTGVGLLSVRRIVETSGGTLELGRSEALGGASVVIELPAG